MSRHDGYWRPVPTALWTRPAVRRLGRDAQLLYLYLRSGPHTTSVPGLLAVGEAALAEALRWPVAELTAAMDELTLAGLARIDREARVVWLPGVIDDQWPASSKVVSGWRRYWADTPDCPLREEARRALRAALSASPTHVAAFDAFAGEPPAHTVPDTVPHTVSGTVPHTASDTAEATVEAAAEAPPPLPPFGGKACVVSSQPHRKIHSAGRAADALDARFDRFWAAYPKKTAKVAARLAWDALSPDDALVQVILAAVAAQAASEQWRRGVIPNASTWLEGCRWEDELPVAPRGGETMADKMARVRASRAEDERRRAACAAAPPPRLLSESLPPLPPRPAGSAPESGRG